MLRFRLFALVLLAVAGTSMSAAPVRAQNPLVPGYFADPSLRRFGDTYYLYVTTDGYGPFGNDGETMVWVSKDLVDWHPEPLRGLPNETVWAPAVIDGADGRYYLYTQNSVDYSGYAWVGDTPTGPFRKAARLGGFDVEPFRDPASGKVFLTSADRRLLELDNDPASPTYLTRVVAQDTLAGALFDYTEGPYLSHRGGLYTLTWAGGRCWQESYNVRTATSRSLAGPYEDAPTNPLIETDRPAGVFGPGHSSVVEVDGRHFMLYHRQDALRAPTCNYRFATLSEVRYTRAGTLEWVGYVDDWGAALGRTSRHANLALGRDAFANTEATGFRAAYAVDGRNDTRWTTAPNEKGVLTVDLGRAVALDSVTVDFEYPDKWLTFALETSADGERWRTVADHRAEAVQGHAARTTRLGGTAPARYVRLSVLNSEDRTASVWEIRAYGPPAGD